MGLLRACGGDGLVAPVHSNAKCCLALGGFLHLAGHSSQPVVRYPLFLLSSLVTPVVIVQEEK